MAPLQTVFRLSLPSNPKNIGRVETFLKKIRHSVHLDEIQYHKLMVSLTEAVNNAIIHGNKSDARKRVAVVCEVLPGQLVIIVADQGKGFRLRDVKSPLTRKNLLKTSGRGIFLMRTLMDKVEFLDEKGGCRVALWLNLTKQE